MPFAFISLWIKVMALEGLGLEVGQQVLHRREEEAVVGGAGQHGLAAAEGLRDGA